MARRFRRDNFLFPLDLRQGRVETAARPTDPFERASEGTVEQAPTRPFELNRPDRNNRLLQLADSLGVAARTSQTISDRQYQDFTERAVAAGQRMATEDALNGNRRSFKTLISQTRQSEGDQAAREVMALSPHVQRGFDQTRARSAALNYNASLQSAYAANPLLDEATGLRLHDVDVESDEYQNWLSGFTSDFYETADVNNLDLISQTTINPATQDAQNRVTLAHSELRSNRRLEKFETESAELVTSALYELNGNPEWLSGESPEALQAAANLITAQLDEANALGYGGEDLQLIYAQAVETVIATATTTGNASLLDVLDLVEVGNPNDRGLLMNQRNTAKYKSAVLEARRSIADYEYREGQRNRTLRDQRREDSMNDGLERLALMAGLYENAGRTPEAYQSLEAVVEDIRGDAARDGWTVELNGVVGRVLQEAVDNQGVNVIDYPAMANLENSIINEQIGGTAAQRRLRDLYISGALGNNQQAADNFLRLSSKIKANDDQNLAEFGREVDQAASEYESVIRGRLGYTEDANGQITTVRETLQASGFDDRAMQELMGLTQAQLEERIQNNARLAEQNPAIRYSSQAIQAMSMVVNGGVNPLQDVQPIDPADITRQSIEFKNQLYRGLEEFREANGRDMTPQERGEYIRSQTQAAMTGQRASLPRTNPLSSSAPQTEYQRYQDRFFDGVLDGVGEATGNPRTTQVMDNTQVLKAFENFIISDTWHPQIVALADANGMSPMELIQRQSSLNGVEIDPDLMVAIGLPTAARPGDSLDGFSVFARNRDVSRDYAQGNYSTFKAHFIDDSPPGSYDFTFIQNDKTDINVPAPFDGIVTEVWDEASSGGYGNGLVIKDRATGTQMFIAHAAATYLQVGDRFIKGQALMRQGSTGNSTGDHLHVEVLDNNGNRITDRSFTRPLIDNWIRDVESGFHLQPQVSNVATENRLPTNNRPARFGHPGYDEATNLVVAETDPGDGYEYRLQPQAAQAYNQMKQAAAQDGINLNIVSAFRSVELQRTLWNRQVQRQGSEQAAARISAPPGHSAHHTGLTVDLNSFEQSFANTEEFRWLQANAGDFGFSLDFGEDGSGAAGFEPWQWSYTGTARGGQGGPNRQPSRNSEMYAAISSTAGRLGVDPLELAAVLAQESSLNPNARGGDGDQYVGLWQASPDVQQRYGVYQGQPVGEQLAALERYLSDRGYTPEKGLEGLYASILVGNADNISASGVYNPGDSNGTDVLTAIRGFQNGPKRREAEQFFGF